MGKKKVQEQEVVIHGFKGFDKDMKCRGFQFEEGKEYETKKAKACETGFHACEYPLDVFNYYDPANSIYRTVEQSGKIDRHDGDTKVASTKIKIGATIDIEGLIKASFDYIKERCTNSESGKNNCALTSGDRSALTSGDRSALTGGDSSALTSGDRSALTGGDRSALTGGNATLIGLVQDTLPIMGLWMPGFFLRWLGSIKKGNFSTLSGETFDKVAQYHFRIN